jgi:hypothetical protein
MAVMERRPLIVESHFHAVGMNDLPAAFFTDDVVNPRVSAAQARYSQLPQAESLPRHVESAGPRLVP